MTKQPLAKCFNPHITQSSSTPLQATEARSHPVHPTHPFDHRPTMFLQRSAVALARRAALTAPMAPRAFTTSARFRDSKQRSSPVPTFNLPPPPSLTNPLIPPLPPTASKPPAPASEPTPLSTPIKPFHSIQTESDLLPPGAAPGTVPSDLEQATGLERLEILGKMENIDIFDMKPLDASRKGTLDNPIVVRSFGDEQYAGCTGYPADSHVVVWLTVSVSITKKRMSGADGKCIDVAKSPRGTVSRVRQRAENGVCRAAGGCTSS